MKQADFERLLIVEGAVRGRNAAKRAADYIKNNLQGHDIGAHHALVHSMVAAHKAANLSSAIKAVIAAYAYWTGKGIRDERIDRKAA